MSLLKGLGDDEGNTHGITIALTGVCAGLNCPGLRDTFLSQSNMSFYSTLLPFEVIYNSPCIVFNLQADRGH